MVSCVILLCQALMLHATSCYWPEQTQLLQINGVFGASCLLTVLRPIFAASDTYH